MRVPKSFLRLAAGMALSGALVLAGCSENGDGGGGAHGAGGQRPTPEVGIVTLKEQVVDIATELPGRTTPYLIAEVRPQVTGIIQKRAFEEGSEVKAGDLLYQIDPASYQATVDSARATVAKAEATVTSLRLKAQRYKELAKVKAVAQQEYDDADAALKQAEAEIALAKASLESALINLEYTRVTAPISGRIGRSSVTQGALVTANQATALATIQQLDPIYVDVTQSATEALKLRHDLETGTLKAAGTATVRLILEDGTPYPLDGKMEFAEVTVDQGTGAITLRALFPNPQMKLLPGLFVRALVLQGVNDAAILIPQKAVSRDPRGNPIALFLSPDNKVEERQIVIGRAIGDNWLVEKGAAAGDRVIVEGTQKVRAGAPANGVEIAAPPVPAEDIPAPAGAAPAAETPKADAPAAPSAAEAPPAADAGTAPATPPAEPQKAEPVRAAEPAAN
ncbi:efflux RND transporter periplasmic adaptor subunit [Segnochrobactraceae bacterium EtOH-i3]